MLSTIAKAVAREVLTLGGTLIFPNPVDPSNLNLNSDFSSPNRVSAVFEEFDKKKANEIKEAAFKSLMDLWDEAMVHIENQVKVHNANPTFTFTDPELPKKQIEELLEFYWVAVPFEEDNYPQARDQAEALLAARKNTRDFKIDDGDFVPKSSLDGIRESVIPEPHYNRADAAQFLYKVYRARGAERLSGVDLLKRLGRLSDEHNFPSTSDVAAAPLMSTLTKSKQKQLIQDLKMLLIEAGIPDEEIAENASLVFESRFREYLGELPSKDEDLKKYRKIVNDAFDGELPNPYYCLFIADGDNMGKRISDLVDINSHSKLSQDLSTFAATLPDEIKKQAGTCIYAGGEDILAYLPLHTALEYASQLNVDFKRKIGTTLSGGLVIAHHLTPLNEVMRLAREAEKESKKTEKESKKTEEESKKIEKKNALTVVLSKRSGADTEITDNWGALVERLLVLKGWIKGGLLGQGVGYELEKLARDFQAFNLVKNQSHRDAIANEAIRIIDRKKQANTTIPLGNDVKNKLREWIVTDKVSVAQLADEIIVASEFTN